MGRQRPAQVNQRWGTEKDRAMWGAGQRASVGFAPPAPMAPSHSAVALLTWEGGLENVPPCGAGVSYHVDWTLGLTLASKKLILSSKGEGKTEGKWVVRSAAGEPSGLGESWWDGVESPDNAKPAAWSLVRSYLLSREAGRFTSEDTNWDGKLEAWPN